MGVLSFFFHRLKGTYESPQILVHRLEQNWKKTLPVQAYKVLAARFGPQLPAVLAALGALAVLVVALLDPSGASRSARDKRVESSSLKGRARVPSF